MSSRNKRLIVACIGIPLLAVACALAPMPIFAIIWGYLWFTGVGADAPGSVTPSWIEWIAYVIPAVVFIATMFGAVVWVRHGDTENI